MRERLEGSPCGLHQTAFFWIPIVSEGVQAGFNSSNEWRVSFFTAWEVET